MDIEREEVDMITPENVLNVMLIGAGINIILALVIAGQWQEMRAKRFNEANIKQAQMVAASTVIRKGHE
jgi:hypothetical protein